jgi:L-alanine-DL-glutamate epimerase-like enolase superfamily enzyme
MSTITRIEITHHQLPLDPPFPASWDTRPRTQFPATIVRVFDDAGNCGIGSGDSMYGFSDYQRYFIGEDPLNIERHAAVLSNIEFHAGRPWPLDLALWDLIGKIKNEPVWSMIGGFSNKIRAYASSGVHRSLPDMVKVARQA